MSIDFPKAGVSLDDTYALKLTSWLQTYSTVHVNLDLSQQSFYFAKIRVDTNPVLILYVDNLLVTFYIYDVSVRAIRVDGPLDSLLEEILIRWLSKTGDFKGSLVHLLEGLDVS
jgi:hypothetical protein